MSCLLSVVQSSVVQSSVRRQSLEISVVVKFESKTEKVSGGILILCLQAMSTASNNGCG